MKYSFRQQAITGLLCLALVACDSDDDDATDAAGSNLESMQETTQDADTGLPDSTDTNENEAGTSSPAPASTPAAIVSVFDGVWASNCAQELSVLGVSEFQQVTLEVVADTFVRTINSFTDSDCSVASVPSTVVSEHSMQFPEGEVDTIRGVASFVDITLETIAVDGVDASGLQQTIGIDAEFNIFVVGDDGRLYFGVPGLSAADRPTELHPTVFFEAQ